MNKAKIKPVAKYHRDLQNVSMKGWTSKEQAVLFVVLSALKENGTERVSIDLKELKSNSNITSSNTISNLKILESVVQRVGALSYFEATSKEVFTMPLFSYFGLDLENKALNVEVSQRWDYILNRLGKNFTAFNLWEFASLDSSYSKTIYRNLKQYRKTGIWSISEEEFRFKLGYPNSYDGRKVQQKILGPALKELERIFPDLHVRKKKDTSNKNKIIGYEFTWTPEAREKFDPNKYKNLDNGDPNNYSNSVLKEYNFSESHSRKYTKVGEMNYLKLDNFKDTKASRNRYDLSHWVDENGEVVVFETWMGSLLRERRYDDDHVEKIYPKNIKINIPEDILKELKEYAPEEVHIISNDPEGEALIKELIEEGFFDD